jgi:hypothetical protein
MVASFQKGELAPLAWHALDHHQVAAALHAASM